MDVEVKVHACADLLLHSEAYQFEFIVVEEREKGNVCEGEYCIKFWAI